MKKAVLALFFALFFCPLYFAVSSNEAVNFVVKENSFLLEGENYKLPVSPISDSSENFWVVPAVSDDVVVTFFPVREKNKSLSASRATNREIFRTAGILRELFAEKERVSKSNSVEWIFTPTYTLLFSSLALSLNNETFQLNTVSSTLNDSGVTSLSNDLKSDISSMIGRSNNISALIDSAVKAEAGFDSSPSVLKANDLREKYADVFSELRELNSQALEYRSGVNLLKEKISKSSEEPATKTYLIALSDPPAEFNSIGNYALDASEIEAAIESVYSKVNSGLDFWLDTFDVRVKRNTVYQFLFGTSAGVSNSTSGKFSSVKEIVDFVFDAQNQPYWAAKGGLSAVDSSWKQAQKSFNEQNYETAEFSGKKALSEAQKVVAQGFEPASQPPEIFSGDTIFQVVTVLVIFLALFFAYNNRGKISGFVKGADAEKEVEIRGF